MTEFSNSAELQEHTRTQRLEAKRALWLGRCAFLEGISPDDNPYRGWKALPDGLRSHQCLLWCRWLLGWLTEWEKRNTSS